MLHQGNLGCFTSVALGFTNRHQSGREKLARDKRSSLYCAAIIVEEKSFYDIENKLYVCFVGHTSGERNTIKQTLI
jgi:hypothetical protein